MRRVAYHSAFVALVLALGAGHGLADAVTRAADRLVVQQYNGKWPDEAAYTGAIVAGLVHAYEMTGDTSYKTSAELGGGFILDSANGNFLGEEAYGLVRLSDISADPESNTWRTQVLNYYDVTIRLNHEDGTVAYITDLIQGQAQYGGPSVSLYYLACHVVSAYYVDAIDKEIWRIALYTHLADLDDNTWGPVWGLGATVWALAKTGPLGDLLIDENAPSGSLWHLKTLADLPGMLASHQVASGDYAGSFYWYFDHVTVPDSTASGQPSGQTEPTVFATLGLLAAHEAGAGDYASQVADARATLEIAVKEDGQVYYDIWMTSGWSFHAYAGEVLQVIEAVPQQLYEPGDVLIVTEVMAGSTLNITGPAPGSLGIQSIDTNANPPAVLYAIRIGTDPGAGWLRFVNSGPPDNRDDVYADGTEAEWHTASGWAGKRLRGLCPGAAYGFYAKAKNATEESALVPAGSYSTNGERDCNRSGAVSVHDLIFARDAALSGAAIGAAGKPWATDVDDSGDTTTTDLSLIADRVLGNN